MRIAFHTFGCKLNQCESEAMASAAADTGMRVVGTGEPADIYILNTCTVTSKAEQKARRIIRKILREHPEAAVVVTGCYAQLERSAIGAISDRLIIVPQEEKDSLLRFIERAGRDGDILPDISGEPDPFAFRSGSPAYHTRPFLKIQDGCNNRCAYCRVPLARGNSVSLSPEAVIRRLAELDARGFREVVLTGVNITAYRDGDMTFDGLLERILAEGFAFRIRLSSLEPDMVTPRLADLLTDGRICPHFHLPVQSGSDSVLAAMGRHYDSAGVRRAAGMLMSARSDPFMAADVITGFPGETDDDFRETLRLVEDLPFSQLHVFPFSPRPGTRAYGMKNRVPERVARERSAGLLRLSDNLHSSYLHRWKGREVSMLLLEKHGTHPGDWLGMSGNYLQLNVTGVPPEKGVSGVLCGAVVGEADGDFTAYFIDF